MNQIILTGGSGSIGTSINTLCRDLGIATTSFSFPRLTDAQANRSQMRESLEDLKKQYEITGTLVFHLAHPGIFATKRTYDIFFQNSVRLFQYCYDWNIPLVFASSASCFTENTSFYSRYKKALENSAIEFGHQILRFGLYLEKRESNVTLERIEKFCNLIRIMGHREVLKYLQFFVFDDDDLVKLIQSYQRITIPAPRMLKGEIRYLVKEIPITLYDYFFENNSKPFLFFPFKISRMLKNRFCRISSSWNSPKGIDSLVNFFQGHKIES